jgi:hypothetical protein
VVHSQIWLNLPRDDRHISFHLPMDDRHLGSIKKFLRKHLLQSPPKLNLPRFYRPFLSHVTISTFTL